MTYWYYTFERIGLDGNKYTGKAIADSEDKFFPLVKAEAELKEISKYFELKAVVEISELEFDKLNEKFKLNC